MRPIIIHDQMQAKVVGSLGIDPFKKANKFLMPMSRHAVTDDFAIKHAQGSEKCSGAVTLVVVSLASRQSGAQGQQRPGSVQRLNLTFFINAQDDGLIRGI